MDDFEKKAIPNQEEKNSVFLKKRNDYHKKYRLRHRDQINAYNTAYYKANQDKIKAQRKKWRAENKEQISKAKKAYYAKNSHKGKVKVPCNKCGKILNKSSMYKHQKTKACKNNSQ